MSAYKVLSTSSIETMAGYTAERQFIDVDGELFTVSRIDKGGSHDETVIFPALSDGEIDWDKFFPRNFKVFKVQNADHGSAIAQWLDQR